MSAGPLKEVADTLTDNLEVASEELRAKRLSVCASCDRQKFGLCLKCGCILKAKVWLKNAECPEGKWE